MALQASAGATRQDLLNVVNMALQAWPCGSKATVAA